MFVLQLNPMRGSAQRVVPAARAETREALLELLRSERVEPYKDSAGGNILWHKCFRKGGQLEWFNDPGPSMESWIGVPAIIDVGTREDWMAEAARRYDQTMADIPPVRS